MRVVYLTLYFLFVCLMFVRFDSRFSNNSQLNSNFECSPVKTRWLSSKIALESCRNGYVARSARKMAILQDLQRKVVLSLKTFKISLKSEKLCRYYYFRINCKVTNFDPGSQTPLLVWKHSDLNRTDVL